MSERTPLDELAFEMFTVVARMEYALKAAGFRPEVDGDAKADWVAFGNSIHAEFSDAVQMRENLSGAVSYLTAQPPRKQTIVGGELAWADAPPTAPTETATILLYVNRVRNNLFHGGKFGPSWDNPERSQELLSCCLLILSMCREMNDSVAQYYG